MDEVFKTHNAKDGKPKTCKFCRKPVWWHAVERRWYDEGGKTLHVENCARGQAHYHDRAMNVQEYRRQMRLR